MINENTGGPRSDPGASDQGAANFALRQAAERLLQLLERETAALCTRQPVDMDDLCNRKNQALLELSRIGRRVEHDAVDDRLRATLAELRRRLDENRSALKLHLQAVGEVADILATAIRDAESDGTYSTGGYSRYLA
jgi:hypothetical protein